MLFNSVQFFIFFAIVYSLYLLSNHRWQNRLLLVASYVFYGAWDWRFLSLIVLSTILDYFCGLAIYHETETRRRKLYLAMSVAGNLGMLGFFKYFNFFATSLTRLVAHFGWHPNFILLHIVLPVGISFYTFQTMSYTIDIYRRKLEPTRHFFDFALFVSFFPQLVAGPIERASRLLPQVLKPRTVRLEDFYLGSYLIFWGLFKKVFVADNLATIVQTVFDAEGPMFNGAHVLIGLYAFAFQIYCDFSGYSDIARGVGRCMGFDIMVNFNLPYFARNPAEFWKRWHISLSSWLRDYLYIPLGGNRKGPVKTYRNLTITMLLGGLWHGAAWTFVLWGAYQGLLLVVHRLIKPVLDRIPKPNTKWLLLPARLLTTIFFFHLVCIGWLFFRAQWGRQALGMLRDIFLNFHPDADVWHMGLQFVFYTSLLMLIQLFQYLKNDLLIPYRQPAFVRGCLYAAMTILILLFGVTTGAQFIYFQF